MSKHPPEVFLLDMDGVLYHGDRPLPAALRFMKALAGHPHAFLTNNPTLPPERVADKLERMGCSPERCLMIGDRPDTDIAGAARLGMPTALVRSGRFASGEAWPDSLPRANLDVDDLDALMIELGLKNELP